MLKEIKWFIQRGMRGYADCDVWDFDEYIARVLVGGLKKLKEDSYSYPASVESPEAWAAALETMIEGFEASLSFKNGSYAYFKPNAKGGSTLEINQKLIDSLTKKEGDALDLFRQYFGNLWS